MAHVLSIPRCRRFEVRKIQIQMWFNPASEMTHRLGRGRIRNYFSSALFCQMVFGHTFEVPQTSFFSERRKTQICPCQHLFQILGVWKKISEIEMGDFRKRGEGWKWGEGKPQLSSGGAGSFGGLDVGTSLSLFLRYTPRGWREKSSKGVGEEGREKNFSFFCLFSSQSSSSSSSCERECGMFSSSELLLSWGTALLCPLSLPSFFHLPWGPLVNAVGTLPPSPLPSSSGWNPTLETEVNQCSQTVRSSIVK